MATNDNVRDVAHVLAVLSNEDEFICKPLQSGYANEIGATECGKIVSRLNKVLFDYQIGDKANLSIISSIFSRRIIITVPETKQVVLDFYQNRLPVCCRACMQQDVRCFKKLTGEIESIGSIREGYVVIKSTLFR